MSDMLLKMGQNIIFAGNVDRNANEPNLVINVPATEKTNAMLLYKSEGSFGANMGVNSHGVVIGVANAFIRFFGFRSKKITGQSLLRLALENTNNAKDAAKYIASVVAGQEKSGNMGFSFLISDREEAYQLEVAGKFYAIKKIEKQMNISNRLRMRDDYTESNMPEGKNNGFFMKLFFAKEDDAGRSFRLRFADPFMTYLSGSKTRSDIVNDALTFISVENELSDILRILKSHNDRSERKKNTRGSISSVCMHGKNETTGSMVVITRKSKVSTIWVTGSSTPCLSIYKPTFFGIVEDPVFENEEDAFVFWRDRELINRAVFEGKIDEESFKNEISKIQESFIGEERKLFERNPSQDELKSFVENCARVEMVFYNKYSEIKRQMLNDELKLSRFWKYKTKKLKKSVM